MLLIAMQLVAGNLDKYLAFVFNLYDCFYLARTGHKKFVYNNDFAFAFGYTSY